MVELLLIYFFLNIKINWILMLEKLREYLSVFIIKCDLL